MNTPLTSSCNHTNHLFAAPFCESQTRLKRCANIIFHIFTLAIPLLIYYLFNHCPKAISCCCFSNFTRTEENLQQRKADSSEPHDSVEKVDEPMGTPAQTNRSPLQEKALERAYELLDECPDLPPFVFLSNYKARVYGPLNQDINRLTAVYNRRVEQLTLIMSSSPRDSEFHQKVLDFQDDLMKLAFAISYLTLEELPLYVEARAGGAGFDQLNPKPKIRYTRTPEATIDNLDGYVNCAIRRCHIVYCYLRGACQWSEEHQRLILTLNAPKGEQDLFYQANTLQNSWRELHNEFCQLFLSFVSSNTSCRTSFDQDLEEEPLDLAFMEGGLGNDRWNIIPVVDQKS